MLFFHLDVCQEFMYKSSKYAFCKMCVTIYGKFCSNKGVVAGYGNQIREKYIAKWGVQIMGMIFQTRFSNYLTASIMTNFTKFFIKYPNIYTIIFFVK